MKSIRNLLPLLLLLIGYNVKVFAGVITQPSNAKVVVIAAPENIKSNYFYPGLIAEHLHTSVDSLNYYLNTKFLEQLQLQCGKTLQFVDGSDQPSYFSIQGNIEVTGEGDVAKASISKIGTKDYNQLLLESQADYVLVINQHYFKKQEDGSMNTIFHIVSYTLFDSNQTIVSTSSQNYSVMKLLPANEMVALMKKPAGKMVQKIEKALH